jgi:hypothetical protein
MPSTSHALHSSTLQVTQIDASLFSDAAKDRYTKTVDEYVRDLADGSLLQMRRATADVVSSGHVDLAAAALGHSPKRRRAKVIGTAGGLACGVGLGQLVAMISNSKFTTPGVLISFVLAMVGLIALSYSWSSD